ncbi:phosphatidylserine decarboxylase family protein [Paracrocinitomix mangrovi]|uniref:phosphatidylserine decarboxylase family protein n=1 Tax=Paracrocinitomix mangrovi TaxID=2862509 RepID=UPI001C8DE44D|nr:phosphatidylserine decarboxylase family protein [Paracrocinitomix mangrovi]UKN01689.1 phosphatidylserine decarboxylase family protein [Paracrocinitomix mangrovi]
MKIHKEGFGVIAVSFLIFGGIYAVNHIFLLELLPWLYWILTAGCVVMMYLIIQFFRVPKRIPNADENTILCPADGKVVVIEEVEETEYFKDRRIQISIFMSPMNVHAQWNPISGETMYYKYHEGSYLVAWHPKSSTENERTTVVTKHANGKEILFRQIAGAVARRIKCYAKEGEIVKQGEEFGFIRFGSRVDVFLPLDAKVNVKIDEIVKGKITQLAYFK